MVLPPGLGCRFFRIYFGDCLDDKRSTYIVPFFRMSTDSMFYSSLCPLPTTKVAGNPPRIPPCDGICRSHYWGGSDFIKASFRTFRHCQPSTKFLQIFWVCNDLHLRSVLNNYLKHLWIAGPMFYTWSYSLKILGWFYEGNSYRETNGSRWNIDFPLRDKWV